MTKDFEADGDFSWDFVILVLLIYSAVKTKLNDIHNAHRKTRGIIY